MCQLTSAKESQKSSSMPFASTARTIDLATATSLSAPSSVLNVRHCTTSPSPTSSHISSLSSRKLMMTSRLPVSNLVATSASLNSCANTAKNEILSQRSMTRIPLTSTDVDFVRKPERLHLSRCPLQRALKRWLQRPLTRRVLSLLRPTRSTRYPPKPPRLPLLPRPESCPFGAEQRHWLPRILKALLIMKLRKKSQPRQLPMLWMSLRRFL